MSPELDLERLRAVLESERARLLHARQAVHHDGSLLEETGILASTRTRPFWRVAVFGVAAITTI